MTTKFLIMMMEFPLVNSVSLDKEYHFQHTFLVLSSIWLENLLPMTYIQLNLKKKKKIQAKFVS